MKKPRFSIIDLLLGRYRKRFPDIKWSKKSLDFDKIVIIFSIWWMVVCIEIAILLSITPVKPDYNSPYGFKHIMEEIINIFK